MVDGRDALPGDDINLLGGESRTQQTAKLDFFLVQKPSVHFIERRIETIIRGIDDRE